MGPPGARFRDVSPPPPRRHPRCRAPLRVCTRDRSLVEEGSGRGARGTGAEPEPSGSTKERLLDAAERLLAERGYEAVSVRAVTRAAGVAVSAANYHFGSKDALVREALRRRLEPMNARRLERLARVAPGPGALEAIVEAFLRPVFELRAGDGPEARALRKLPARLHLAPPERAERLAREIFGPVFERFLDALEQALPGRSRDDLGLALQLSLGAALHTTSGLAERFLRPGAPLDGERVLRLMVRFAAAGIRESCPTADAARPSEETLA
jgi:AcrR family transcriptional regulator